MSSIEPLGLSSIAEHHPILVPQHGQRGGVAGVVALEVVDRDAQLGADRHSGGEHRVCRLHPHLHRGAEEAQAPVLLEGSGEQAGFGEHLEPVADADHRTAVERRTAPPPPSPGRTGRSPPDAGSRHGRIRRAGRGRRTRRPTWRRARPGRPMRRAAAQASHGIVLAVGPRKHHHAHPRGHQVPDPTGVGQSAVRNRRVTCDCLDDRIGQQAVGHHRGLGQRVRSRHRRPRRSGRPCRPAPRSPRRGPVRAGPARWWRPADRRSPPAAAPRPAPRIEPESATVRHRTSRTTGVRRPVRRRRRTAPRWRPRSRRGARAAVAACPMAGPRASPAAAACRTRAGWFPAHSRRPARTGCESGVSTSSQSESAPSM